MGYLDSSHASDAEDKHGLMLFRERNINSLPDMEGEIEYLLKNVYSSAYFHIDTKSGVCRRIFLFYIILQLNYAAPCMPRPNSVTSFKSGSRLVLEGQRNV